MKFRLQAAHQSRHKSNKPSAHHAGATVCLLRSRGFKETKKVEGSSHVYACLPDKEQKGLRGVTGVKLPGDTAKPWARHDASGALSFLVRPRSNQAMGRDGRGKGIRERGLQNEVCGSRRCVPFCRTCTPKVWGLDVGAARVCL